VQQHCSEAMQGTVYEWSAFFRTVPDNHCCHQNLYVLTSTEFTMCYEELLKISLVEVKCCYFHSVFHKIPLLKSWRK
jgi:hypothetical protein